MVSVNIKPISTVSLKHEEKYLKLGIKQVLWKKRVNLVERESDKRQEETDPKTNTDESQFSLFFQWGEFRNWSKNKYMCIESTRKIFIMEHVLGYSF